MSKKDRLPKELRVEKSKREKRIYEKALAGAISNKKNTIIGPMIIFFVLSIILIIFFRGHLEVAIVVIAFLSLVILARWFFNR